MVRSYLEGSKIKKKIWRHICIITLFTSYRLYDRRENLPPNENGYVTLFQLRINYPEFSSQGCQKIFHEKKIKVEGKTLKL